MPIRGASAPLEASDRKYQPRFEIPPLQRDLDEKLSRLVETANAMVDGINEGAGSEAQAADHQAFPPAPGEDPGEPTVKLDFEGVESQDITHSGASVDESRGQISVDMDKTQIDHGTARNSPSVPTSRNSTTSAGAKASKKLERPDGSLLAKPKSRLDEVRVSIRKPGARVHE
jgi:hypothetical protein